MKVICINDKWKKTKEELRRPSPCFGEECDVTNSKKHQGDLFYQLGGRFDRRSGFIAENFATVSSIDETEFERSYNKQLV